jgi:DNA-3-methyladenine glycosylase
MLNLVTEEDGTAGAVLVRALEPLVGIDVMSERRAGRRGQDVANGPGKLAQALGIDLRHNGTRLGVEIALFAGERAEDGAVGLSGRVGLSAGHELALRYYVQGSRYISRGRTGPKAVRPRSPEQKGQA